MDFLEKEFQIADTRFKVEKFQALEGWRILESIRAEIGKAVDVDLLRVSGEAIKVAEGEDSQHKQVVAFVRLILGLSEDFVDRLRGTMNKVIYFRNRVAKDWMEVSQSESTAYMGLGPVDIYMLLGRSLAVNFFDSFQSLLGPISLDHQASSQ